MPYGGGPPGGIPRGGRPPRGPPGGGGYPRGGHPRNPGPRGGPPSGGNAPGGGLIPWTPLSAGGGGLSRSNTTRRGHVTAARSCPRTEPPLAPRPGDPSPST